MEERTLRLASGLTKTQDSAGLKQGLELTWEGADAGRRLELVREPWPIENGSHDRRDVTPGEDQRRVRKGAVPQVMAGLRSTPIHLAWDVGPTLAAATRRVGNCFTRALTLLGLPQLK